MYELISLWRANSKEESGQALVEYGLILGLISLAAIIALTAMGGSIDGLYGTIETLANAMADALAGG